MLFCVTVLTARDEGCRVKCISKGYDSGAAYKKGCRCIDLKESYDDFIHNRMSLGPRPDVPFQDTSNKDSRLSIIVPDSYEYP